MIHVVLLSLVTGLAVGILFTALKLPLPAPNALAGVMGILGIYLGSLAWPIISKLFS
ncbi:MAG: XapX domain-containing protein [Akkermansiaceae bacterium]